MGTHSGKNEDQARNAGLTPCGNGRQVGQAQASATFVCKKLYGHQFAKEDLADEFEACSKSNPGSCPLDENGNWQTHYMFVGQGMDVIPGNDPRDK